MDKLQGLLRHIQTIVEKNNEIQDASGGRFNVFGILGIQSAEKTHSAFLAELLDPQGSHGLKEKFLESFIRRVYGEESCQFKNLKGKAYTEYNIGRVTDTSGGQIDILVREQNKEWGIVIENKIYAGDQLCQLIRYDNYARKKKYKLLYLTLDGSEASDESCGKGDARAEYTCISYKEHILGWLDDCLRIAAKHPHVRETISQYIAIIRELTNQNIDMSMDQEIFDCIFKSEKDMEMALKIKHVFNEKKQMELADSQFKAISEELGVELEGNRSFVPSKWKNHKICFSFESELIYGIIRREADKSKKPLPEINAHLGENWKISEWWPLYRTFYPKNSDTLWLELQNGEFKKNAKKFVQSIVDKFGDDDRY